MRILAIDPGSRNLGWVYLINHNVLMGPAVLKLPGNVPASYCTLYYFIRGQIEGFGQTGARRVPPDYLALESYFPANQYGATVIPELRGVIKLAAAQLHVPVIEIAPGSVKKFITGKGNSDKSVVRDVINCMYKNLSVVSTDEADAVAIGLTALNKLTGWTKEDFS